MRLGSVLAGADDTAEQRMGEYGRVLGMAFQIVDDVLDLTATEEVLGQAGGERSARGQGYAGRDPCAGERHGGGREAIQTVLTDMNFETSDSCRSSGDSASVWVGRLCHELGFPICGIGALSAGGACRFGVQAGAAVGSGFCGGAG